MTSSLVAYPPGSPPSFHEVSGSPWTPLFQQQCSFPPEIFRQVMLNLIKNPNINSSRLFRADISFDSPFMGDPLVNSEIHPRLTHIKDYDLKTVMVRTMIPRNILVDKPLDQTCLFHENVLESGEIRSLVTYLPHTTSAADMPFYHPAVRGIGFLHNFNPQAQEGSVSIHYSFFDAEPPSARLERTAQHLLAVLHKHGKGSAAGYVKRVHHDQIIPQALIQNTYSRLKSKYARILVQGWVESTDASKHVFEDLSIAAFLIELWAEMYNETEFPGFVDIGCGNGLLVHILLEEGYPGWGFDARRRKSWATYSKARENLKELVLIPSILQTDASTVTANPANFQETEGKAIEREGDDRGKPGIHNGTFPKGTFIISNHADELTPWTPILATLSESPFIMIPCCSHDLSGARFRAPAPKGSSVPTSAYASLVTWITKIGGDCGWVIEKEMLRIPSTRNTALVGRHRNVGVESVDARKLVEAYGGASGWEENAMKLVKGATRGH